LNLYDIQNWEQICFYTKEVFVIGYKQMQQNNRFFLSEGTHYFFIQTVWNEKLLMQPKWRLFYIYIFIFNVVLLHLKCLSVNCGEEDFVIHSLGFHYFDNLKPQKSLKPQIAMIKITLVGL
jgi:hypothetical protein